MVLINPSLEYKTIRDAILTLLRASKDTLNTGLTSGKFTDNEQIACGYPVYAMIDNPKYPLLYIKWVGKDEAFRELGHAGRKIPSVIFKLYAVTRNKISKTDSDDEVMLLVRNIEAVFRDNIEIPSSGILYSILGNNRSATADLDRGFSVDVAEIDLTCIVEVK